MESDARYYWRRAFEELSAATRAVTPAARERRHELAALYCAKLKALSEPASDLPNAQLGELERALARLGDGPENRTARSAHA